MAILPAPALPYSSSVLVRQANDPLAQWAPHAKQRQFLQSVLGNQYYENYALWANRGGKSRIGSAAGSILARYGAEPARPAVGQKTTVWDRATSGWVVSLDFPASRDVIQPLYFDNGFTMEGSAPFIPSHEVKEFRKGDQILLLKNGSQIGFKSAESGRDKFQGVAKDWLHLDEVTPYDVYSEATMRIGTRPLRTFMTATLLPESSTMSRGIESSWLYEKKVVPWLEGLSSDYQIFTASIYENPYLLQSEVKRLEARYPEGSTERAIRLNGELLPGMQGSRAYMSFEQRIHVRENPPLEFRRPLCWFWDFNVSPLVSGIGQRVEGEFRIYDELIMQSGSIPLMCDLFKEMYPRHGAALYVYGDATGGGRTAQTGQSSYALILAEMRGYPVPVTLKVPTKNPPVLERIHAMNRALEDEEGVARLVIDPRCTELIADMRGVLRDRWGGILKTSDRGNAYADRTHISDALGYWVTHEAPVSQEPIRPKQESIGAARYTSIPQIGWRGRGRR